MTATLVQDYLEPLLKYQKIHYFEEENDPSNETEYSYLRLLPDMSEGLIGLCIGDIMGILLSVDNANTLNLQQQQYLKLFIETLLKTSKSSFSIFKLSILYLYKLNKKLREPKLLNIFRTNLYQKNILSMEPINQAKLLFVVIIMLAFKYTEDHCYYISAWSKATGIKSEIIHKVEVEVLNALDHNLFVSKERFESFSNRIIQKINKLKIDLLQSVKISYASSNYSSSSEEESVKSDNSSLPVRCRKCHCKRKQECLENISLKKRRMSESLSVNTNNTENSSTFCSIPSTLYDYYKIRNGYDFIKQPLTPPTPTTYTTGTSVPISTGVPKLNANNNLLQVDSLIIPSTPPTSQTSVCEDIEREEEIKNCEDDEEDYEYDKEEDEEDEDHQLPKSSSMAFILNPDENKIQFDSGENNQRNIQAKTVSSRYHTPSPRSNFAYHNLRKVNLLEKKNEKTRTTASIVLPNTSPVGEVASVFPSLSMFYGQPQNDGDSTEDTKNKPQSVGLQSIIVSESQDQLSHPCPLLKTNFMTIRNDDTITTNNETNYPYFNNLYTDNEINKQKILLSIYNCYAMRNIRHYQI